MSIGSLYRPFLEAARDLGVDIDAVLARMELTYDALIGGNVRLAPDQGRTLARHLRSAIPAVLEPGELGLRAAERFVAADADLVGYLMAHSASPLEAARALMQHARLLGDSADYRVIDEGARVRLTFGLLGGKQMVPEGSDFAVAVFVRMLRDCTHGRTHPLEVHLPRAKPRRTRVYQRFFGVPVQFAAEVGTLVYDHTSMLLPFTQSDQRLLRILTEHAIARSKSLPPTDEWQSKVRSLIAQSLQHGNGALDSVAWQCGVSERTLRRRLAEAGTSYRALIDDVRKERALALLAEDANVSLVAQRLGFADATAFARAFRRWTGRQPSEHLRALRSAS